MPGIELSTLNAAELRSLLSAAQRRDQSTLADEVAAELVERSARPARWAGGAVLTAPEDAEPPRSLAPALLGVVIAGAVGVGIGWQLSRPPEAAAPAPVLPVVVAPVAPPATPAASATKLEVLAPSQALRAEAPLVVPSRANPAPPPPRLIVLPARPVESLPPAPERVATPVAPPPSAPPTVGSPHERRLRVAYERAIEAGVDPRAIDRGQARWRQKLTRTRGAERRAALYDRRIGELEAAARWNGGR